MVSAATKRSAGADPTHYPVDDAMGESILHKLIVELLRPLVERWLDERAAPTFVGANQFIYWVQHEPTRSVAPDLYVLPGVPRDAPVKAWKVWETGLVPSFALEIVSNDVEKDYWLSPARYADLGILELVVFDPESSSSPERVRWQVFRKSAGGLVLEERTDSESVRSTELGCWLRSVGNGPSVRIRLCTGARGEILVATEAEAERAAREAEEVRRAEAEAEVARLRAELARLHGGR